MLESMNNSENNKKLYAFIKKHYDFTKKSFLLLKNSIHSTKDRVFEQLELSFKLQSMLDYDFQNFCFYTNEEDINYIKYRKREYDSLGSSNFPRDLRKLYFVVTNDPAQLFFQSTGYNWNNCCDLNSHYGYSIPQVLVNKDRMIYYITDGEIKEFNGIEYYKILTYGDLIRTKNNFIFCSKNYPMKINLTDFFLRIFFHENKAIIVRESRVDEPESIFDSKSARNPDKCLEYNGGRKIKSWADIFFNEKVFEVNGSEEEIIQKMFFRERVENEGDFENKRYQMENGFIVLKEIDKKSKK